MPYDVLLEKLEETDPELVDEVRGFDEFHDLEDDYHNYARAEIIDWGPDAPFLESDHPRRDPALSRSILNLHYNATRGSQPELPRHPELFYGFTGNDPRGANTDPRFDQVRGHITSRAANLTVSMGDNDDHHEAERPWTGQSISYGMKEIHRRLKNNVRVFPVQKEGRPWSNNVVADNFAGGDLRAAQLVAGDESLAYQTESFYGGGPVRFAAGDYGPAVDLFSDGVRGPGVFSDVAAPWRHSTGDADLGVQQYGQKRGAGRSQMGPGAVGGGRTRTGGPDQDWAESQRARSTNRQVLGATMAQAARYRRALKSGRPDQDWTATYEAYGPPGAGLTPSRDVALLYRHAVEDQSRRPEGEVQDGDGGMLGSAAGLTPAAHPEHAIRASEVGVTPNAHLTNVESIVTGLREGTAAGRRRIAGQVVADGARNLATAESEPGGRRGALPSSDYGRIAQMTEMPLQRSAAAGGLEVHTYRGAPPTRPERRVAVGQGGYDSLTWRRQHEALPVGRSRAPGEWRSATQGQYTLGDAPEQVFGYTAEYPGGIGAPTGPKGLRPGGWSDSANLSDSIGGFSDGLAVGA